jgi:hypothetical protein
VSATVAPAALDRVQHDRCAGNQSDGRHVPQYSASSFAMNAAMFTEFMAMRHGGCVALIR